MASGCSFLHPARVSIADVSCVAFLSAVKLELPEAEDTSQTQKEHLLFPSAESCYLHSDRDLGRWGTLQAGGDASGQRLGDSHCTVSHLCYIRADKEYSFATQAQNCPLRLGRGCRGDLPGDMSRNLYAQGRYFRH